MKVSYNWLKWYVPQIPEPEKLAEAIVFHAFEVESIEPHGDDFILDIKTLPDRNHDCLSHLGIAREVSAILNIPFVDPKSKYKIPESHSTNLAVMLETPHCRRYSARIVRNVKVGPSPDWVKQHLESIGQRSINNIVDATNLTMFNCGQPCHAFDLNKISGGIVIRSASAQGSGETKEKITLLTGEEKKLDDTMTVISDLNGNALAIAGVKGGKFAEVNTGTTDILIEVANFEPVSVRKTAKALNIQTDSTKRFENDLSPELAPYAMRELSALIAEMFPDAVFEDIVDVYPEPQETKTIVVMTDYINKKLGTTFRSEDIESVWKRLKFEYTKEGDVFTITQPVLRLDLGAPHDFVEEVGRILGYDKVDAVIPKLDQPALAGWKPQINDVFYKTLAVKKHFIDAGYSEVMTYTFRDKGEVEMLKTASDKKFLRTNLKDGLSESLAMNTLNAPLLGIDQVKIFEIGTVFSKNGEQINITYNEKKNIVEMSLDEFCEKNNLEVKNSYDEFFTSSSLQLTANSFQLWSPYPFIARDVAVWVPGGVESSKVHQVIKENAGSLLVREPRLVDTYTKDDKTSYAFRLVFQSFEKTLTDAEVEPYTTAIYKALQENGFEIR